MSWDMSTRGIERQRRRMTSDLAEPPAPKADMDELWKELIATALRRNVVVAVAEHRAAIEAALRASTPGDEG